MKRSFRLAAATKLLVALGMSLPALNASGCELVTVDDLAVVTSSDGMHGVEHQRADSRFAPSKPMSVIHFVKPERYLASSGDTLTVSLTLKVSMAVEAISVSARAEKGAMISGIEQDLGALEQEEERKVSFEVTVLSEGRHYINVLATANTSDGMRRSSHSIPIEVGNTAMAKKRRYTVVDDQGNTLLLMPAETTTDDE